MATLSKSKRLKKELTLLNVYAIATGTTLSAGFFLLPGLAASEAGPALILSYLIAAIPLIPDSLAPTMFIPANKTAIVIAIGIIKLPGIQRLR